MHEAQESISAKILQQLKVNGLVRSDYKIIKDMDESLGAGAKSSIIPVAFNKDGSIAKKSQVASKEQFETLSSFVREKIKDTGREILDGMVAVNPYQMKKQTACDYCSYRDICGFDGKIPGYQFRRLPRFEEEEVWRRMEENIEENSEGASDREEEK